MKISINKLEKALSDMEVGHSDDKNLCGSVGTKAVGTKAVGTGAVGTKAVGTGAVGTKAVGTGAVGTKTICLSAMLE